MRHPASWYAALFTAALLVSACDRPTPMPPDSKPSEPGPEGGPPPESAAPLRNSLPLEFPMYRFGPRAQPQRTPALYTC